MKLLTKITCLIAGTLTTAGLVIALPAAAAAPMGASYAIATTEKLVNSLPEASQVQPATATAHQPTARAAKPDTAIPAAPSAQPVLTPEPTPVACTNSYPDQSCTYDNPPVVTPKPELTPEPMPVACTNSWPEQSCTY